MIQTYLGLARTVPTVRVLRESPYTLVSGPSDLSFCNFAAGFDLDQDAEQHISDLATHGESTPGLWAFVISSDTPDNLETLLTHAGFERRQYLVQMVWQGSAPTVVTPPTPVTTSADRMAVAQFMADTFFVRTSLDGKLRIAYATATSSHSLQAYWVDGQPRAAVMSVLSGGIMGLYNLCTDEVDRGRGYGRALVRQVQKQAAEAGVAVCLQCNLDLQGWYQDMGFRPVGEVEAFSFVGSFPFL